MHTGKRPVKWKSKEKDRKVISTVYLKSSDVYYHSGSVETERCMDMLYQSETTKVVLVATVLLFVLIFRT